MMTKLRITPARVVRWLSAIATLALAAALCVACLALYRTGTAPENLTAEGVRINDIYTRENVGRVLKQLAPAAAGWAILLIIAAIMPGEKATRPGMDPENALRLLKTRTEVTPAMRSHQKYRRICRAVTGVLVVVCLGWIAGYMTDVSRFTSWDLEMVMGNMVRCLALPACLTVLCLCVCQALLGRSYAAELEEARKAPRRDVPVDRTKATERAYSGAARVVIAIAAVMLIAAGIINGGMYDVLVKAINICTECIGLG